MAKYLIAGTPPPSPRLRLHALPSVSPRPPLFLCLQSNAPASYSSSASAAWASILWSQSLCKAATVSAVYRSGLEVAPSSGSPYHDGDGDAPTSIELVPIVDEEHFDRILADAHRLGGPVIMVWMASWCRKCIYLKPKLEKLAADYHPRIRFYSIDVNAVPQRLVNRAGITKMPAIQLWRNSEKQAEMIGGHKAWLVVDEIRKMIDDE